MECSTVSHEKALINTLSHAYIFGIFSGIFEKVRISPADFRKPRKRFKAVFKEFMRLLKILFLKCFCDIFKFLENLRKSSESARKSSKNFGKFRKRFKTLFQKFWGFFKIFGKSSEVFGNYRKICGRNRNCSETFAIFEKFLRWSSKGLQHAQLLCARYDRKVE